MVSFGDGWLAPEDTLPPLTTVSYLAVQCSSYGDLPVVIHIGRKVHSADVLIANFGAATLSLNWAPQA